MPPVLVEKNKKPGVYYAVADDGLELPVIDVTHPAFAVQLKEGQIEQMLQEHIVSVNSETRLSKWIQPLVLRLMARNSRIMQGLQAAAGGYLTGMNTYILKLGPDMMGRAYASEIDRHIAASIAGLSVRLRVQNVAHLLAAGLLPLLSMQPGAALHLLNIGSGPAIDSLNALIILRGQRADLLAARPVVIHSLDLDEAGPHFGQRALAALQEQDAPLHGLEVLFEHVKYDWTDQTVLRELLRAFPERAIVAASSEGALFEYGPDAEITGNLRALHDGSPAEALMVGSVTRADETGRLMNGSSRAALQMRGIEAFAALARAAGWVVASQLDRPSGHDVCLKKA